MKKKIESTVYVTYPCFSHFFLNFQNNLKCIFKNGSALSRGDGERFLSKHSKIQKSPRSGLGPKSAQMGGDSSDALELRENRSSPVRKERNQNREDFFKLNPNLSEVVKTK